MNIFAVDFCPRQCALALDDQRLSDMLIKTHKLLLMASYSRGSSYLTNKDFKEDELDHPIAKWVRETRGNYWWTYELFVCMSQEYTHRFKQAHPTGVFRSIFDKQVGLMPEGLLMPFVKYAYHTELEIDYSEIEEACLAYRVYLQALWALENPKWTNREKPDWAQYTWVQSIMPKMEIPPYSCYVWGNT